MHEGVATTANILPVRYVSGKRVHVRVATMSDTSTTWKKVTIAIESSSRLSRSEPGTYLSA